MSDNIVCLDEYYLPLLILVKIIIQIQTIKLTPKETCIVHFVKLKNLNDKFRGEGHSPIPV